MKHIVSLTLIIILVFTITACAAIQPQQSPQGFAEQQGAPPKESPGQNQLASPDTTEEDDSIIASDNNLVGTYPIVDTNQLTFYSDRREINSVSESDEFYGQDATYIINPPSYTDNGDGTVTDTVTGLMWQQTMDEKMTYKEAVEYAENITLGGYDDWRIPTIKELFSLIDYTGSSGGTKADALYIDTDYFDQPIGDVSNGEREIDAQVWSSTFYVGNTMGHPGETLFGVNFIDGRIKGYEASDPRGGNEKTMYFRLVRGVDTYGINNFVDNGDGTITDRATGLMWQAADDGITRDWSDALANAEDSTLAGYDDWRLPSAKELQSIVDYTKSPQTTSTPAIDDLFTLTQFTDVTGDPNYGFYWTSTTHLDGRIPEDTAVYVSFGEALGKMNDEILDVHGAGAVRSDPKNGNPDDYPAYHGPQGDIQYVFNYSLMVRTAD